MQLETVSKIKGWVALAGLLLWIGVAGYCALTKPTPGLTLLSGFSGLVGLCYSVAWIRLRARMREIEYAGRVFRRG